jgi:C1A family cysteine protease
MRVLLALACIAGVAMCAPLGNTELKNVFETYKTDFKKVYAHASEELLRFKIFADNVNIIRKFNQEQAATEGYTMGINQFTDWSRAEYRELLGYNASAKKPNPVAVLDTANLADSVDWTTKGAVTPVKNQQSCGSCWAFSTTGAMEGALAIKNKKLVSLSEQELVDCAGSFGNQGCNGGLMDNGFKYLQAKGDELEASYAYTAKTGTCDTTKQSAADGEKPGVVTGISDVKSDSCPDLMAAVQKGPVSVAIEADQSGFQHYSSGIFSGTCGTQLDHGVLVVGYGTDGGKDYWKVKNSWGTTWGDQGYIRMAKSCGSSGRRLLGGGGGGGGSKEGTCGILHQASYPEV